ITRIEIDAPVIDLPALQHWLASRPPGETRIPTLSDGLAVSDGRIDGDGWRIDDLALSLPRLHPDRRVDGRAAGQVDAGDFALRFRAGAVVTPAALDDGLAVSVPVTASDGDCTLPARLRLSSASVRSGADGGRSARLRASLAGRYDSGAVRLPSAFALTSP